MDDVYEFLIGRMNYDVVCIIKDKVEFLNHQEDFMFCLNQIININQEHDYHIRAWMRSFGRRKPPRGARFYKHILRNNRIKHRVYCEG